ncbi:UbiA family prenyltransferase [Spirosoma fluminis]
MTNPRLSIRKRILQPSQRAISVTRAGEWWGYKMAPLLAVGYATVGVLNQPLWPLTAHFLLLVLALTVGAVFVSVLNDWTDLADDRMAGKTNRLVGKPLLFVQVLLALCLAAGLGFTVYFWRLYPLSGLLYLGSWVAYSLYSLAPVRLKIRGLAGILADALGAHVFPQLLIVSLVEHWVNQPVSLTWWVAVSSWSMACGIRNILKHQLGDASADDRAGVRTLVSRWGWRRAHRLGAWVAFPVEVLAFGVMLMALGQAMPILFLIFYWGLEALRARFWQIRPVILDPNQRIVFDEYYSIFFPVALLLTQCLRYPADGIVLVLHGLFFGAHALATAREAKRLLTTLRHAVSRQFN